jgi:hypothetical protein
MHGHACVPNLAFIITLFMLITSFVLSPEASSGPWLDIIRRYRSYKMRMHEKRCRKAREKLKKYWVIEMNKFHL